MALPPQIQTVTVSFGPFVDFQGIPLAGSTRFTPSTPVNHAATGTPILNRPINVAWDEDGRGVLVLPATDSVGLDVTGFTYRVQHTFSDGSVPAPPSNSIQLPAAVPSVDLDLLIPVPAQNGVVVSVPGVVSVAGKSGVVTGADLAAVPEVRAASRTLVLEMAAAGEIGGSGGGSSAPRALGLLSAAIARRTTTQVRFGIAGSSTARGTGADSEAGRWFNQLIASLQAAYPSGRGSEVATVASDSASWTVTTDVGIAGYNAGDGGTTSSTYLYTAERARVAASNLSVLFHLVGSNDFEIGRDPATYRANIAEVIADIDSQATSPILHILIHAHQRSLSNPTYPWSAYGDAMRSLAAAAPDRRLFLDVSQAFAAAGVPTPNTLALLGSDGIHLTQAGHNMLFLLVRQMLGIPVIAGAAAPADTTKPTISSFTASPGNARVDLSWSGTDNVGITRWVLTRDGVTVVDGAVAGFADTGRTNDTQYGYTLVAYDAAGNVSTTATAVATPSASATPALSNTAAPTISPTTATAPGTTLTTTNGTWSATPDSFTYQWRRAGTAISGATSASYALQAADAGQAVTCAVTAVKAGYTSDTAVTAAVTPTAGSTPAGSFGDNFNRADATSLAGSTTSTGSRTWVAPTVSKQGAAGTPSTATFGIVGQQVKRTGGSGSTDRFIDLVDTGSTLGELTGTLVVAPGSAGGSSGGVVAIATADGTIVAYLGLRSSSTVRQYAFFAWVSDGATASDITASTAAVVPTSADTYRIVRNANRTLTAFINGVQACVSNVLPSSLVSAQHAGYNGNADFTGEFDNFGYTAP